jgi:hypothetical protein
MIAYINTSRLVDRNNRAAKAKKKGNYDSNSHKSRPDGPKHWTRAGMLEKIDRGEKDDRLVVRSLVNVVGPGFLIIPDP